MSALHLSLSGTPKAVCGARNVRFAISQRDVSCRRCKAIGKLGPRHVITATSHDWQQGYGRDVGIPHTGEI